MMPVTSEVEATVGPNSFPVVRKSDLVQKFHEVFRGLVNYADPMPLKDEQKQLRYKLMLEEVIEWSQAETLEDQCKEIIDVLYVAYGTCVSMGLSEEQINALFMLVHESNMSKSNPDGTVSYREDGKVLKGANYKPVTPNEIEKVLNDVV
jgi:predicted HAD superfamily Cof-like phosphohydrolase